MSSRIRVLHLFDAYLNITQNWAFRIIDNLPDTDVVVGAKFFLKNNFYRSRFNYIEFPIKPIEQHPDRLSVRIFNALAYRILRFYPRYVSMMVGKVDLIHSHFSMAGWEYLKLARKLNVPHIVSFYGCDYENLPYIQPVWHKRYRILFKEADLFLCEGNHGARVLENIGCPSEKIRVARLGVDAKNISFYARDKQPGDLKLLTVATLVEKKGHIYTVRAFIEALKECPNMTLTLVGADAEGIRIKLQDMLKGSEAANKVSFIDRIDYDHLYEFMHDYHIFIHPSCYSSEKDCEGGAPVVLLDAQATGMPVISTTHCDIPDEVVHGETGVLSAEKDVTALSLSIKMFYHMGNTEYQGFTQAARLHIETNYNVVRNSAEIEKIYRELIASCNQ